MASGALTEVQEDCLFHRGDCSTCPNRLLSGQCQVKFTESVAPVLGLQVKRPDKTCQANKTCQLCGCKYKGSQTSRNCKKCRDLHGDRAHWFVCQQCSRKAIATSSSAKRCRACAVGVR